MRVLHREYGFAAAEILSMSEEDCHYWLGCLDDSGPDAGSSDDTWENVEG